MKRKVLTASQIEQFMECGWVRVEEAFSRKDALKAQDFLWEQVEKHGVLRSDKSTWTKPMVHFQESFNGPEFQVCNTTRLAGAIEDLVGEGRWAEYAVYGENDRKTDWGWWPVNFSIGAEERWNLPTGPWHWDGSGRKHYVDSPEQGLLPLCIFSEIGPRGGGTLVAEGSHKVVARMLDDEVGGQVLTDAVRMVNYRHSWLRELTGTVSEEVRNVTFEVPQQPEDDRIERFMNTVYTDESGVQLRVVETTASPGDVFLCHPFLYHIQSANHSGVPRFMCNRATPLKERMNLHRANPDEYSPLELSIVRSIR